MKLVAFLTLLSSALIPAALADSTVTITPGRYLELDTGAVSSTRGDLLFSGAGNQTMFCSLTACLTPQVNAGICPVFAGPQGTPH